MKAIAPGIKPVQSPVEYLALLRIYRRLKPKNVVEIGSFKGGTLYYWLKYAQPKARVISIDLGPAKWNEKDKGFDRNIWNRWVPKGVSLFTITGNSKDPVIIAQVKRICPIIDFLFIDGGHKYETVQADFENYGAIVRKGGIIALHDIIENEGKPQYGVHQLYAEIKADGYKTKDLITKPGQSGMGIGVIFL
jgi:cephalosporin hydroxylase